jgi:hypothetical protein
MNEQTITYNGWTNHETWLVSLWLNNDHAQQQPGTAYDQAGWLSEQVRNSFRPSSGTGLFTDLIMSALDRINWLEIVEDN